MTSVFANNNINSKAPANNISNGNSNDAKRAKRETPAAYQYTECPYYDLPNEVWRDGDETSWKAYFAEHIALGPGVVSVSKDKEGDSKKDKTIHIVPIGWTDAPIPPKTHTVPLNKLKQLRLFGASLPTTINREFGFVNSTLTGYRRNNVSVDTEKFARFVDTFQTYSRTIICRGYYGPFIVKRTVKTDDMPWTRAPLMADSDSSKNAYDPKIVGKSKMFDGNPTVHILDSTCRRMKLDQYENGSIATCKYVVDAYKFVSSKNSGFELVVEAMQVVSLPVINTHGFGVVPNGFTTTVQRDRKAYNDAKTTIDDGGGVWDTNGDTSVVATVPQANGHDDDNNTQQQQPPVAVLAPDSQMVN